MKLRAPRRSDSKALYEKQEQFVAPWRLSCFAWRAAPLRCAKRTCASAVCDAEPMKTFVRQLEACCSDAAVDGGEGAGGGLGPRVVRCLLQSGANECAA